MKKEIYGLSRNRDKKGIVVKRSLNPYVNCLHTLVGSCRENMEVYVMEIGKAEYEERGDNEVMEHRYRIRKLTPRECFRLMGVDDTDIDTMQSAGISNSQQYKLAGNSIVVDVLYHIFRKAFCEKENENQQQTLF